MKIKYRLFYDWSGEFFCYETDDLVKAVDLAIKHDMTVYAVAYNLSYGLDVEVWCELFGS